MYPEGGPEFHVYAGSLTSKAARRVGGRKETSKPLKVSPAWKGPPLPAGSLARLSTRCPVTLEFQINNENFMGQPVFSFAVSGNQPASRTVPPQTQLAKLTRGPKDHLGLTWGRLRGNDPGDPINLQQAVFRPTDTPSLGSCPTPGHPPNRGAWLQWGRRGAASGWARGGGQGSERLPLPLVCSLIRTVEIRESSGKLPVRQSQPLGLMLPWPLEAVSLKSRGLGQEGFTSL